MGLGPYQGATAHVSLKTARMKAEEIRTILGRGGDPFAEMAERAARVRPPAKRTFGEVAADVLDLKEKTLKSARQTQHWRMTLNVYGKALTDLPVSDVTTQAVVDVLKPIWTTKPETASRLRARIERVLSYAKSLGLRDGENPARLKGHLDALLGDRDTLSRGHHAAMPYDDVPAFMARLRAEEGLAARALELTILTAARTIETLGATWAEFDGKEAVWNVPAERMKMKKPHAVPLSARAVEIIADLRKKKLAEWVFPGLGNRKPLSNMAMSKVLKRMAVDGVTVHGFRSSFRDWAGDRTAFPRDVAEAALAHKIGDATEQAYRRSDAIEKRRKLMDAWARFCLTPPKGGNVVPMGKQAGQ